MGVQGRIAAEQTNPCILGYNVNRERQFDQGGMTELPQTITVESHLVRRHFAVGSLVQVYREPQVGWVNAEVQRVQEIADVKPQAAALMAEMAKTLQDPGAEASSP